MYSMRSAVTVTMTVKIHRFINIALHSMRPVIFSAYRNAETSMTSIFRPYSSSPSRPLDVLEGVGHSESISG